MACSRTEFEPDWHKQLVKQGRWKPKKLPKQHAELWFEHSFTEQELENLRIGINPEWDEWGDERWLVCQKGDVVYFYRSWTGCCFCELHLNLETNQHRLLVNQDPKQYTGTIESAKESFEGLFRRLRLGRISTGENSS